MLAPLPPLSLSALLRAGERAKGMVGSLVVVHCDWWPAPLARSDSSRLFRLLCIHVGAAAAVSRQVWPVHGITSRLGAFLLMLCASE